MEKDLKALNQHTFNLPKGLATFLRTEKTNQNHCRQTCRTAEFAEYDYFQCTRHWFSFEQYF